MSEIHVLNGDALKEQFPPAIQGEIIVCRECLIEGDFGGGDLEGFYDSRANYLSRTYGGTIGDYYEKIVPEFERIIHLPKNSKIYLWFEDDLFCQTNFWFVCHLITNHIEAPIVKMVRPNGDSLYGFGGMDQASLKKAFDESTSLSLSILIQLSQLWLKYVANDFSGMLSYARKYENELPFVKPAVEAHINRYPSEGGYGRPERRLLEIKERLQTNDFGKIFREFNRLEHIYGFGDIQVKRMWDDLNGDQPT